MKTFESSFPEDYRKEEIGKLLTFASKGKFCQLVCIPGTGKATILRLLAHNNDILKYHLQDKAGSTKLVYVNLLELYDYSDLQVFKFLILSLDETPINTEDSLILLKQLNESINKSFDSGQTLIFLFDHFDEYISKLNRSFFQMLTTAAKGSAKYKFSAIFGTRRDVQFIADTQILSDFWELFTDNAVYFKISDEGATEVLFNQLETVFENKLTSDQKNMILEITGGHAKLTKIITELTFRNPETKMDIKTLLENPSVKAALYEIWLFLTSEEQLELYLLSQKKSHEQVGKTNSLIQMDIIDSNHNFTIPIFKEFVKTIEGEIANKKIIFESSTKQIKKGSDDITELLSPQEYKLLKFLIDNQNRLVERDELIEAVWPEAKVAEAISDEAIDQMVFRLRKKIENEPGNPRHLMTVKGKGLKFIA